MNEQVMRRNPNMTFEDMMPIIRSIWKDAGGTPELHTEFPKANYYGSKSFVSGMFAAAYIVNQTDAKLCEELCRQALLLSDKVDQLYK